MACGNTGSAGRNVDQGRSLKRCWSGRWKRRLCETSTDPKSTQVLDDQSSLMIADGSFDNVRAFKARTEAALASAPSATAAGTEAPAWFEFRQICAEQAHGDALPGFNPLQVQQVEGFGEGSQQELRW